MRNLPALFVRLSLRDLRSRPLWTLVAGTGIALGVSLTVAVGSLNHRAVTGLRRSTLELLGRPTVALTGGADGVHERLARKVARIPGVMAAAAVMERGVYVKEAGGERLTVLAIDLLDESALRLYAPLARRGSAVIADPLLFLSQPESILLGRRFAERHGYVEGSRIRVATSRGQLSLQVQGFLGGQAADGFFGGNLAIMDLAAAQLLLGRRGRVDRVEVAPAEGVSAERLGRELRLRFPRLNVTRGRNEALLLQRAANSLARVLACLGLFTVIAGSFLIFNLATTAIAERQGEIEIIRSLGGSRGSIVLLFVSEGLAIGMLGTLGGTLAGLGAAALLTRLLAGQVASIVAMPLGTFDLSVYWPAVIAGAGSGVLSGMLGFLLPALAVSGRPEAVGHTADVASAVARAGKGGCVRRAFLALGLALFVLGLEYRFSIGALGPVADATFVFAAALLLPWFIPAAAGISGGILDGKLPLGFLLAARNVAARASSTGTVAAVALAVAVIVVFATIQKSIGGSIGRWMEDSFAYDLEIASESTDPGKVVPLDEGLAEELASVGGVKEVRLVRWVQHNYRGRRITIHSLDYARSGRPTQRFLLRQGDAVRVYKQVASGYGVAVSENLALHFNLAAGDLITVKAPRGRARLKIVAVVVNYNSEEGTILMSRELFQRYWGDRLVNYFLVMVTSGANVEDVRAEIGRRFGRKYHLVILTLAEAKARVYEIIRGIFRFIYALEGLVVVVGFLTIAAAISASVIRRRSQFAAYRVIGMTRRQLSGMVGAESALLGAISAVAGTILGIGLSVAWVKVHCSRLLGWVVDYAFPGRVVGATLVITIIVAVLAGFWPACEASRVRRHDHLPYS